MLFDVFVSKNKLRPRFYGYKRWILIDESKYTPELMCYISGRIVPLWSQIICFFLRCSLHSCSVVPSWPAVKLKSTWLNTQLQPTEPPTVSTLNSTRRQTLLQYLRRKPFIKINGGQVSTLRIRVMISLRTPFPPFLLRQTLPTVSFNLHLANITTRLQESFLLCFSSTWQFTLSKLFKIKQWGRV